MSENAFQFAWFRPDGHDDLGREVVAPEPLAASLWRSDQMHGVAASGLLARGVERRVAEAGRGELVPARWHVDLFRPAGMVASRVEVQVLREGPRLLLLEARLLQDDALVARAGATFLRPGADPAGRVWPAGDPGREPAPEVPGIARPAGEHHVPMFMSRASWSENFGDHQNDGGHATWQTGVPIVVGEECSPFAAAASIADATSMVTNWGDRGVEHINTDVDLALTRAPRTTSLGLRALTHLRQDGVAVGSAEVYDADGVFGVATVTALANTRRTVDLSGPNPDGPGA